MTFNARYVDTVRLLLEILPMVFASGRFAMKGGTAINLFVQDMPRLSVDIDLVWVDPTPDREADLAGITGELSCLAAALSKQGLQVQWPTRLDGEEVRLLAARKTTRVKVEANAVFRGTLLPVRSSPLTAAAAEIFDSDVAVPTLAVEELYGSKLVAAMDRQHPRDLFDVIGMWQRFGWNSRVVDCFVGYLAGHNRPVHEVLFSAPRSLQLSYGNEFRGMTRTPVSQSELESVQRQLLAELPGQLTKAHREFLASLVRAEPDWSLMPFAHLRHLPAVRWKLDNLAVLRKKQPAKFEEQYRKLMEGLER
ncbi:nucleotidyl transferase AbiEii/AbiGii toxin family protein [Roseateles sp. L2-2]|uniref:nucleotidyl transferase AbiEii/AbiGii toxin family protein n=1 Tax=Roseateles sp. L2-2 TaxID=3422597 RepID=UPI003D36CEFC